MDKGSESREHAVPAIPKVAVEREGAIEAQAIDQLEAGAIGEAEGLVVKLLHARERASEQWCIDENDAVTPTLEQATTGGCRCCCAGACPKPSHQFGHDEAGQHEPGLGVASHECDGLVMMLVVFHQIREQGSRVREQLHR